MKVLWVIAIVALLLGGTALVLGSQQGPTPLGTTYFSDLNSKDDVTSTDDVIVGDDLNVTGLATIGETLDVTGASTFTDAVVNSSTTQLVGAVNLDGAVDLDGVVTNAANLEHILMPTIATASFTYTQAAGSTVNLFTIGASETWLVTDIRVEVTTNWDCTGDDCTINIGDGNDADGFCVLTDTELQAADTEATGWLAGWQCQVAATRGVYIDGTHGFIYDGTDTIDAFLDETSGDSLAGGAATVYLTYTRLE